MKYTLVVNSADGIDKNCAVYAIREFKDDAAAIKAYKIQTRYELLKKHASVDCTILKESLKIFNFTEARTSDSKRSASFLQR